MEVLTLTPHHVAEHVDAATAAPRTARTRARFAAFPQHGHRHGARHGRAVRCHGLRCGRGQLQDAGTVRHAAEGEHEEDGEDDPAEVAADDDAGVADEAETELAVSAVGGEHAEAELQGEDDVCG